MKAYVIRRYFGPMFSLSTNLWPNALNRSDRETLQTWYLVAHIFRYEISLCGPWGPQDAHQETVGERGAW